jgi:hypothetical protein
MLLKGRVIMKYGVKVIFTYSVEPDNRKFYEESIYLVEAESFEDAYEKVNNDPYGEGWIIKVKVANPADLDGLLDAEAYKEFIG